MKSLLAILALAVVVGAGYWKIRNPNAGVADFGAQASGQAGQISSVLGFTGADTSRLEADLASSQAQLQETSTALESNQQVLDEALQRLDALETRLDETGSQLNDTESRLSETDSRLSETGARLDSTEQALESASNAFESRESSINQRLQAMGGKVEQNLADADQLAPMKERLANLESTISKLDTGFSSTTSALTQRLESDLAAQISARDSAISDATGQVSARIDNLEERVSNVASTVDGSASTTDLGELRQQIAGLQSELAGSEELISERIDTSLDNRLASLTESIEEKRKIDSGNSTRLLRQSVNRMDNRIKAISAASGEAGAALELTSALDDRIDEVENSIAGIEQNPAIQRLERGLTARVDQVGASLEEMGSSIGTVQASVGEVRNSVSELENNVLADVMAKVTAESDSIEQQLQAAQQKVAAIEARIESSDNESGNNRETINTRFSELDQRIGSLESTETQLAAALPQIQAVKQSSFAAVDGDELSDKVQALEAALANLDDTVTVLKSTATKTAADADVTAGSASAEFLSEVALINQRMEEIDVQLAALSGASDTAGDTEQVRKELTAQITELENRISQQAQQAQQPDKRLASEVDQLNKKFGALEQERLAAANGKELGKPNEYKIYFGKDSVSISGDAENVLKSFISQEQNRASSVSIFGFTDRSGNAAYNQRLALRRANGVRSFLIQQGFDFRKINAVDGLGEDPAASNLDDGQEDANQRTVVLYAYQK